jgi:CDP-glycerol glycerophosphotransferase
LRISILYGALRRGLSRVREAERLTLKVAETILPGWLGYFVSKTISPFFRYSTQAARYCRLPVQSDLVMYESYNGRDFAGNPYALFLHLLDREEYINLQHILVAPSSRHPKVLPYRNHPRVRIVRPNSRTYIRYAETCGYFINNASWKPYVVKRAGQVYVYTWHSTLLKKLAVDKGAPWEARNVNRALVASDYFISPNRYTTDLLLKSHGVEGFVDGNITEFGYPRNDLTIRTKSSTAKAKLGIKEDEILVLYAPTWRGEQFARDTVGESLEWQKKLESSLPKGYRVIVKLHTFVYRFLDRKSAKLCAPLGMDTNEILSGADILVTDYSGIFFDFLITKKPIIFFTPDREEYSRAKTGFYLDLEKLPGPVCDTIEEVSAAVSCIDTVEQKYSGIYKDFYKNYAADDDGNASRRVIDLVFGSKDDSKVYRRENRKKRLLFLPGPMNPNGVTTSFIALLSSLDYSRWDAAVLLPSYVKNQEFQSRLDPRAGIFYIGAPDMFSLQEYSKHSRFIKRGIRERSDLPETAYTRSIQRVFAELHFDIAVNFHGYQPGDAAYIAVGVNTDKRVAYLHNNLERDRKTKQPQLHSVFSVYKLYDKLLCVSEDSLEANIQGMADYVKTTFGDELEKKMDFARNLINPIDIRSKSQELLDENLVRGDCEACRFITIGRLSPEKNHIRLLDAFAAVLKSYPEAILYIVGDGPLSSVLHRRASSLGIKKSIVFIPFTANPYPLLKACDCFVLSSDYEGQPITILEALTFGKAVISTDIPGPRNQLKGGYGQLVQPNSETLASAMMNFIADGKNMNSIYFDAEAYVSEVKSEFSKKVLGENS